MNQLAVHSLVQLAQLRLQVVIQAPSAMRVLLVSTYLDLHACYVLLESSAAELEAPVRVPPVPHVLLDRIKL